MANEDFIIPQDIDLETSTKVFTEKQIAILGGVAVVFGIIPAILLPNYIVKLVAIVFGVTLGLIFAKVQWNGMILWDYIMLVIQYRKEEKVFHMGTFLPIQDIDSQGNLVLSDGTVSAIYEITGVSIDMMSRASSAVVMQNLAEMLHGLHKASFYAWRKGYDTSRDLAELKEKKGKNEKYFASYRKMLLETVRNEQIGTLRYFIVLNGDIREVNEEAKHLEEAAGKGRIFKIRRIENPVPLLYAIMNLHRAYYQKMEGGEEW